MSLIIEAKGLLFSERTLAELIEVLERPKFDRYVSRQERQQFLLRLHSISELIHVFHRVQACHDPEDNKFLDVAVNGSADGIVTGDQNLLVLHPFHSIPIITPAAFLGGFPKSPESQA